MHQYHCSSPAHTHLNTAWNPRMEAAGYERAITLGGPPLNLISWQLPTRLLGINLRKWRLKLPQSNVKWHAGQIGTLRQAGKGLFFSEIVHFDDIVSITLQDLVYRKLLTVRDFRSTWSRLCLGDGFLKYLCYQHDCCLFPKLVLFLLLVYWFVLSEVVRRHIHHQLGP